MQQESIYNLIPKEYVPPPKEPMYRSAYPSNLVPTGSTFNNHTTSRPKINNINGEFELVKGPHSHKGQSNSLGRPKGSYKPDTTMFRLKNTGTMGSNQLPEIQTYKYPPSVKPQVPKKDEKPIHGKICTTLAPVSFKLTRLLSYLFELRTETQEKAIIINPQI
ncbi:unnamed protein product [Paramecium octaurelia]|uniref:Uncharacterized protein n=1 Tax=Paramecium octaurelia TaxID=43137 RepID=A0A8S1SFL3_PAROT|nr:unnamed protein product [Paramecium octaurelia]